MVCAAAQIITLKGRRIPSANRAERKCCDGPPDEVKSVLEYGSANQMGWFAQTNQKFGGGGFVTRKRLLAWVWTTITIYGGVIAAGVVLKAVYPGKDDPVYSVFKDLLPLMVALPAAWLVYCFQRRMSYLQALRSLWTDLVSAGKQAVEYTRWDNPRSEEDFRETILELTKAVDSLRGVFSNVPRDGTPQGLYPYENLKDILKIIGWLGYGDRYTRERANRAHDCIYRLWAEMHYALLQEFDTEVPIQPVSKYLNQGVDLAEKILRDQLTEEDLRLFDSQKRLPTQ